MFLSRRTIPFCDSENASNHNKETNANKNISVGIVFTIVAEICLALTIITAILLALTIVTESRFVTS